MPGKENTDMTAQEQQKPEAPKLDLEEEGKRNPKASAVKKTAAKKQNPLFIVFAVFMCLICLYFGNYLRLHANRLENQNVRDGYLSPTEFVLIDSETGEPVQKLSTKDFQSQYTFTYGINEYETSRGLKPGDSWYTFAETYGDTIAQEIRCKQTNGTETEVLTCQDMTIREFQNQYINTGRVDPDNAEIDVYFRIGTDGKNLYYSEKDMQRAADQYENSPRILHPLTTKPDQMGFYVLHFSFETDVIDSESGSVLGFLASSFESY